MFISHVIHCIIFTVEEAGGKALPCILDVRDEQQVKAAVKSAVQKVSITWKSWIHRNQLTLMFTTV